MTRRKEPMVLIHVSIPYAHRIELERLADEREESITVLAREAVKKYLDDLRSPAAPDR